MKQGPATPEALFKEWKRKVNQGKITSQEVVPKLADTMKMLKFNSNRNVQTILSERLAPNAAQSLQDVTRPSFATESDGSAVKSAKDLAPDHKQQSQQLQVIENSGIDKLSESEVSSVELDSDDSDFCTTIDIVKLKPNKKQPHQKPAPGGQTEAQKDVKVDKAKPPVTPSN